MKARERHWCRTLIIMSLEYVNVCVKSFHKWSFMVIYHPATLQKTDGLLLIILWCTFLFAPLFVVVAVALPCFDLPCFVLFTSQLITIRWNVCLRGRARSHSHVYELIVSTLNFGYTFCALLLLHFYCQTEHSLISSTSIPSTQCNSIRSFIYSYFPLRNVGGEFTSSFCLCICFAISHQ